VLLRPDGAIVRRLTDDKYKDRDARWSPDGSRLLFLSNCGGTFEYWLMNREGGGLRRVSEPMVLAWAPDGSLVGYPRQGTPYCVDPAVPACPAAALLPADFLPLAWAPDGKRVAGRLRSFPPPREQLLVYSLAEKSYVQIAEAVFHRFGPRIPGIFFLGSRPDMALGPGIFQPASGSFRPRTHLTTTLHIIG